MAGLLGKGEERSIIATIQRKRQGRGFSLAAERMRGEELRVFAAPMDREGGWLANRLPLEKSDFPCHATLG
jgi:hypothetical protein